MNFTKTIIVNAGMAAALALTGLTGCATDGSTPKDFFTPEDDTRSVRQFINTQANKGAVEDATLGAAHFDGLAVNSLGTEKLARMLPENRDAGLTVYLDVPEGNEANSRRDAVIAYLKNCGVAESGIKLAFGPNPNLTHLAGEQLANLDKTNTGEAGAGGAEGGAAAAGGEGMGASTAVEVSSN